MTRQYTQCIFNAQYAKQTGIRVGYIYHKSKGNPDDVIHVEIKGLDTTVGFNCRLDEAVVIAAGLTKVAGQILVAQLEP